MPKKTHRLKSQRTAAQKSKMPNTDRPLPRYASAPFFHAVIDNFLPKEELTALQAFYKTLVFQELHTDLFRFLQTAALDSRKELASLRERLSSLFRGRAFQENLGRGAGLAGPASRRYCETLKRVLDSPAHNYDIFASYYRYGDFLYCHDDMVEDRALAFVFYLRDFPSGELVLYGADCVTAAGRVRVRENRLVVFQVSSLSFHEVARCVPLGLACEGEESLGDSEISEVNEGRCYADGRMAFTGWLTHPGHSPLSLPVAQRDYSVPTLGSFRYLRIPKEVLESQSVAFQIIKDEKSISLASLVSGKILGPLTDRRCLEISLEEHRLQGGTLPVPAIPGWNLKGLELLDFSEHGYVLANDRMNRIAREVGEVVDMLLFDGGCTAEGLLSVADADGAVIIEIDAIPGQGVIGHRFKETLLILDSPCQMRLLHALYTRSPAESTDKSS